jgi:hypothetical protein
MVSKKYSTSLVIKEMQIKMQLKDIMLSEVSLALKQKGCVFLLIHGRQIQR